MKILTVLLQLLGLFIKSWMETNEEKKRKKLETLKQGATDAIKTKDAKTITDAWDNINNS